MARRLLEFLRRSPQGVLASSLTVALLLGALSLRFGFLLDDYVHRSAARGQMGPMTGFRLFDFATGDAEVTRRFIQHGPFPWWTDPELKLSFFRPLSSALVLFDDWAFGDRAWLHHLHSIAWGLMLVASAALVLRRLPRGAAYGAALLLFALDESHWMPVSWIANRNALVAAVPAILALAAHLRWRLDGWRPGAFLSAAALAVALAGGETAAGAVGYLLAFEALGNADPLKRRLAGLLPALAVLAPYVALYKLGHFGASGSGVYLDPLADPLQFAAAAPGRALVLAGCLGLNFPADLWLPVPAARPALIALGLGTAALFAWLLRDARRGLAAPDRRFHDVLLGGSLLSLLPSLATFPASRLLVLPSLGAAGLLALALRQALRERRRVVLSSLIAVHGPIAVLHWVGNTAFVGAAGRLAEAAVARTELDPRAPGLRVLALSTGDAPSFVYAPIMLVLSGLPMPRDWWILSHAPLPHQVRRLSATALELETVGGRFADSVSEQLVRTPRRPFRVGETIALDGAQVTVLAVDGALPTRIRLELDEPLDAPDVRIIAWRDGALRRVELPAVGATFDLPKTPGVLELASQY